MHIGEKILEARKNQGLTRKALSELTQEKTGQRVSESTIKQYEYGTRAPKFDQLTRIAAALNMTIDDLTGDQPESTTDAAMTTILDMLKRHREIEARFEATGTNASEMVQSYAHVADTANELGISADTLNSILKDLILKERANDPKWKDLNLRVERDRQAGRLDHLPPVKSEE